MHDEWQGHAEIWDADADSRLFADDAFASLLDVVDLRHSVWRERRVLDFGCGTGLLTEQIAPWVGEVVALDTSPAMLEVLRAKQRADDAQLGNVTIRDLDVLGANVAATTDWFNRFDLVVASSVCSFLADYPAAVCRFAQAMQPGATLLQWDWLLDEASPADDDGLTVQAVRRAFAAAHLQERVSAHAFDIDGSPVLFAAATKPG